MITAANANMTAIWTLLAALTGGGALTLPDLATRQDLAVLSGSFYEIALESIEDHIARLQVFPESDRTEAQHIRLARLLNRKERLIRQIEKLKVII